MTLDKRHLIAMAPLVAAALVYNIWYFAGESGSVAPRQVENSAAPAAESGPAVAGENAPPVDPTSIPPVKDVGLDRLPQWSRNPFASVQGAPSAVEVPVADAALPESEPDIVVEAIFRQANRPAQARVNGETVRVGDRIGTATVVEIQPKAVVVDSPKGRRTISAERQSGAPSGGAK